MNPNTPFNSPVNSPLLTEDIIKSEPSDEAEKQAENPLFPYILYFNIQATSEKPTIIKYYLVGETVEK